MNGAVRRRGLMGGDEGIVIENPKAITMFFTTSTPNKTFTFGYNFQWYVSSMKLDGNTVAVGNDVVVPEAGEHILIINLQNPHYNSANYFITGLYSKIIFPYNFGSKFGKNGTYKLSIHYDETNTRFSEVYLLDSVPFKSSSNNNGWITNSGNFYVPKGSLQAYIDAGYPASKLTEVKYKYTI